MSIQAKLAGKPGGGHGLTDDLLEAVYGELVKGRSPGLIPALVLLQPDAYGASAKGSKRAVSFVVVRLEPVTDPADADRIRLAISEAYESRQEADGQGKLDLGEEEARRYLAYIEDWKKEQKLTAKQIGEKWRETFGADTGVPGDYRKAGPQPLMEFCLRHGIVNDEARRPTPDEPTPT